MLSYNDLKIGMTFLYEGEPYEVQEYGFLRMQQRKPVAQTKIKNLITGKILERNFHQNEKFEDVEIEKVPINFIYAHRDEFWFNDPNDPKKRFELKTEVLGTPGQFLKANTKVMAVKWGERIITVEIPIKMELLVKDAPPNERGNTAQGGSKQAVLETGAAVSVPLFVNTGDVIKVNTQTGEYVERMEKAK
ncbi:MAG: elongation factor P [bacterium]|nr:elongation factor P [bacterium]